MSLMMTSRAGLLAAGPFLAVVMLVGTQGGRADRTAAQRSTSVARTTARPALPSPLADVTICRARDYNGLTHRCTVGTRALTRTEATGAVFTVTHFRVGHFDHTVILEVDAWQPGGWPEIFGRGYIVDDALYVPLPHIVQPLAPGFYRFSVTTEWGPLKPYFVTIKP